MHGDVGAIPCELKGDRAPEAGRGSRDEGFQPMKIAFLNRGHHPLSRPTRIDRTLLARLDYGCRLLLRTESVDGARSRDEDQRSVPIERTGGLFGSSGIHPSFPSDRGHQSRSMEARLSAQRITSRTRVVFAGKDVIASILERSHSSSLNLAFALILHTSGRPVRSIGTDEVMGRAASRSIHGL